LRSRHTFPQTDHAHPRRNRRRYAAKDRRSFAVSTRIRFAPEDFRIERVKRVSLMTIVTL